MHHLENASDIPGRNQSRDSHIAVGAGWGGGKGKGGSRQGQVADRCVRMLCRTKTFCMSVWEECAGILKRGHFLRCAADTFNWRLSAEAHFPLQPARCHTRQFFIFIRKPKGHFFFSRIILPGRTLSQYHLHQVHLFQIIFCTKCNFLIFGKSMDCFILHYFHLCSAQCNMHA